MARTAGSSLPVRFRIPALAYRLALRIYPRPFRSRYGRPMLQAARDAWAGAYRRRGLFGLWRCALVDVGELAVSGLAERLRISSVPRRLLLDPRSRGKFDMTHLLGDIKVALRSLRRQPTFAVVSVLTLGVAIGANTVIFSVVASVLLEPLPYDQPSGLVMVNSEHPEDGLSLVSAADLADWGEQSRLIEPMAAWVFWSYTYTGGDEPVDIPAIRTTPELFPILRAAAALGRTFTPQEGIAGGEPVAILSHTSWERYFSTDPSAIGRRIELDAIPHTIVGVMPPDFDFPPNQDSGVWTALTFDPDDVHSQRAVRNNFVIGRLAPDATVAQAEEELDVIAARLEGEFSDSNRDWRVRVRPAHEVLVVGASASNAILLLFGAVGALLLIACANVANLILARITARHREFSIRSALGAGRSRLVQQFLVETGVLAVCGGTVGLLGALWGTAWLRNLRQLPLSQLRNLQVDLGVVLFTLALSLVVGCAFGLIPAATTGGRRLAAGLREVGGAMGSATRRRLLDALVVFEVAVALVLLIGAGLLGLSFVRLTRVDPGLDADNLLAANIFIPDTSYPEDHEQVRFFRNVIDRVRALPGVISAGAVTSLPMDYVGIDFSLPITIEGKPAPESAPPRAQYRVATTDYFETAGITLLRGRTLAEADHDQAPRVMMINETLARLHFRDEDPLGEFISIPIGGAHEIIGVYRDLRHYGLEQDPVAEMTIPFRQNPFVGMVLVVRTAGEPTAMQEAVKDAILVVDPDQPVYAFNTMHDLIAGNVALPRLNLVLFGIFAAAALLLATVGIYGVMSYAVTQRTREIGLRMALGAGGTDTLRLVVGRAMLLVAIGLALGVVTATAGSPLLSSLLYDVDPADPLVFAGVSIFFVLVALLASAIPARRAARVDPLVALRADTD